MMFFECWKIFGEDPMTSRGITTLGNHAYDGGNR